MLNIPWGSLLTGLVVGVAVQLQQAALYEAAIYALAIFAAATGLVLLQVLRQKRFSLVLFGIFAFLLCAVLTFGLTGLRAGAFQKTAIDPALEGKDILVVGQVAAMPQFGEDGLRFRFDVESAHLNGQSVSLPPKIYLGWYSGFGGRPAKAVALQMQDNDSLEPPEFSNQLQRQPQALRAGERWQMSVRLKAPHGNSNPHGFDYELWLWEQGIQATGYVRTSAKDTPPKRLSTSWWHPVERARQSVREAIFAQVDNRQLAGVLAALVVGDQNAIERTDWDVFRSTGVAHLMSISGLHITMFAWLAALVIGWLWRRSARYTPRLCLWLPASSAGALGGLLLAALYALFSGWGVPAQRTIWMLATVVLLRQNGKQWPWPVVWLLAMAVVVLVDPWALMQAGFWLSFVAVGILFATDSGAGNDRKNGIPADFEGKKELENGLLWRVWASLASVVLHWRLLGLPLLLPVLLWQPLRPVAGEFELIGADIGQGNAVIVRTASHSLVYDTGPRFSRESDAGNRVLVPLLRALGERVDVLILSHRDIDHIGGAPAVLAMQPQAQLVSSIEDGHELQAVRKSTRCIAGSQWRWDAVDFEVLHPLASDYDTPRKSNTMSCVLRISNGVRTALLVGDLEAPQELRLASNPELVEKIKADFLLMPHHGSKTSSSAVFLDAVKPQIALAQAGYRNRFGHPALSVLERYRERGIRVVKSPVCGAASWRSDSPGEVLCQRTEGLRYWHHVPLEMPQKVP